MQQNTEKQTRKRSHLQLLHSVCSHIYNLQTETCALTLDTHISLSLSCSLIVYLCVVVLSFVFLGRGGGCVPCSRHLPIPPLACATLHLQGIKSEPPESTEKKDKKIGPNENQKHRLSLSLSFSLSLSSSPLSLFCHELGKTREEEN